MGTKLTYEWRTRPRQEEATHGDSAVDLVLDERLQFSSDNDEPTPPAVRLLVGSG